MVSFFSKMSEKERKPYLIQQGFGFFLRQQAQAGSGFQNHRCLYPFLFGNCLLSHLQQLPKGFSSLANGKYVHIIANTAQLLKENSKEPS